MRSRSLLFGLAMLLASSCVAWGLLSSPAASQTSCAGPPLPLPLVPVCPDTFADATLLNDNFTHLVAFVDRKLGRHDDPALRPPSGQVHVGGAVQLPVGALADGSVRAENLAAGTFGDRQVQDRSLAGADFGPGLAGLGLALTGGRLDLDPAGVETMLADRLRVAGPFRVQVPTDGATNEDAAVTVQTGYRVAGDASPPPEIGAAYAGSVCLLSVVRWSDQNGQGDQGGCEVTLSGGTWTVGVRSADGAESIDGECEVRCLVW